MYTETQTIYTQYRVPLPSFCFHKTLPRNANSNFAAKTKSFSVNHEKIVNLYCCPGLTETKMMETTSVTYHINHIRIPATWKGCTETKRGERNAISYRFYVIYHINHVLYHITTCRLRFIFFCSCRTPYRRASAVGGQPGNRVFFADKNTLKLRTWLKLANRQYQFIHLTPHKLDVWQMRNIVSFIMRHPVSYKNNHG